MYSIYDFKYLINHSENSDDIIKSICREPVCEILEFWNSSTKSDQIYTYLSSGIKLSISLNRYSVIDLNEFIKYPQFYVCVLTGICDLWKSLKFNMTECHCGFYSFHNCVEIDLCQGYKCDIPDDKKYMLLISEDYQIIDGIYYDIYLSNYANDIKNKYKYLVDQFTDNFTKK